MHTHNDDDDADDNDYGVAMTTEPYIYARHDTARPLARRPSPGDDERRREQRMPAEKVQMRNGGAKATVNVYTHTRKTG